MTSGVHDEMYVRAGNSNHAGHVRIGVGPPSLLSERPAAMSAGDPRVKVNGKHWPRRRRCDEMVIDNCKKHFSFQRTPAATRYA